MDCRRFLFLKFFDLIAAFSEQLNDAVISDKIGGTNDDHYFFRPLEIAFNIFYPLAVSIGNQHTV